MINDVNNLLLRERGAVTKARPQQFYVVMLVSAVMFCKQFLAYTVHIDWCYHSIHKHTSRSQHAPR